MNYFMQVFIQQGGEWRIAESIVAQQIKLSQMVTGLERNKKKGMGKEENVK